MLAFYTNVLVLAVLAAIAALSLNVLIGWSGIFSAAQGVIYGLGAYVAALIAIHVSGNIFLGLLGGLVGGVLLGLLFAIPATRITGDYFIVASFGFEIILLAVFENWSQVTGGYSGLIGIPAGSLGFGIRSNSPYFYLAIGIVLLAVVATTARYLLVHQPLGRILRAMKQDDRAITALGRQPALLRFEAVMLASIIGGLSGVIYAYYVSFVDPTGFGVSESILFLTMVIFGGAESFFGPIVGALVLSVGTASLGLLPISGALTGEVEQIVVGVVLVVLMISAPNGLAGLGEFVWQRARRMRNSNRMQRSNGVKQAFVTQDREAIQDDSRVAK